MLFAEDGRHCTEFENELTSLDIIFTDMSFGQVYWVDFGYPTNNEIPWQRPAVVIQENFFNSNTVIVAPLSSKIDQDLNPNINPIISLANQENLIGYISERGKDVIKKDSVILFNHVRTVDLSRLRHFLFTIRRPYLKRIMEISFAGLFNLSSLSVEKLEEILNSPPEEPKHVVVKKLTAPPQPAEPKKPKLKPLPFKTETFSESQKKWYAPITPEAYHKLKQVKQPDRKIIAEFLKSTYTFICTDEVFELLIDCIVYTIENKKFKFDLCEYARHAKNTQNQNYDFIINSISDMISRSFNRIKKAKANDFISFISMIIVK